MDGQHELDEEALKKLQASYQAFMPLLERSTRRRFTGADPEAKEEAVQEAMALGWKYWVRLYVTRGNPDEYRAGLRTYIPRMVAVGRALTGQESAHDVMSGRARRAKGFWVARLPYESAEDGELYHALADNRHVTPAEQAAFSIDVSDWLSGFSGRDAEMVTDMVRGETTDELHRKYGVSRARISQKRREFVDDYREFQRER